METTLKKTTKNKTKQKNQLKTKKPLQIQEDLYTNSKYLPAMEKIYFLHNLYTAFPLITNKNYIPISLHHMISCQF